MLVNGRNMARPKPISFNRRIAISGHTIFSGPWQRCGTICDFPKTNWGGNWIAESSSGHGRLGFGADFAEDDLALSGCDAADLNDWQFPCFVWSGQGRRSDRRDGGVVCRCIAEPKKLSYKPKTGS